MIYLLFAFVAVLSTVAVLFVAARKGVVDPGKGSLYRPSEEEIVPYRGKALILITIICFALAFATQISLYRNTAAINFVKLYGLLLIVGCAGLIDAKRRIIPNVLIVAGLIFRAGIYLYEICFTPEVLKSVAVNDLIGFAIGFLFLGLVSLISRGALGFGDAKLFGVIGLISGSFCTYSTLLVSLVISAVVSMICIARKKMGRKDSFPFGPCIAVGYILVVLLTSY